MPKMQDEMTTGEVARFLGFSATSIVNWAKRGFLPVRKTPTGSHRRYYRKDVLRLQAEIAKGEFSNPQVAAHQKAKAFQRAVRSAKTGLFVPASEAKRHPATTVTEKLLRPAAKKKTKPAKKPAKLGIKAKRRASK